MFSSSERFATRYGFGFNRAQAGDNTGVPLFWWGSLVVVSSLPKPGIMRVRTYEKVAPLRANLELPGPPGLTQISLLVI